MYEGDATGKIPDKHFNRLLVEYDNEQSALEQEAAELKEGITAQAEDGVRARRFVFLVRRYTSFDELTAPMLNEFIEKVVVHEADKSTGDRRQKVDIFQLYRLFRPIQAGSYFDSRRSKSAESIGGEEPGTRAKPSEYAPGEGGTAGRKGGRESFLSSWLICLSCCAILVMGTTRQIGIKEV